jgi:glycosyltransferase involved in cell wall biosynthesis
MIKDTLISVIIPSRVSESFESLNSIQKQTYHNIEILMKYDYCKLGAGRIRNDLASQSRGDYLFFCDNDIDLHSNCIYDMYLALHNSIYSWAFCQFKMDDKVFNADKPPLNFNPTDTEIFNYCHCISTMSLIKAKAFFSIGGFDDKLRRFEDWDLFIRLFKANFYPVFVDKILFTTSLRPEGLSTRKDPDLWELQLRQLADKHGICFNNVNFNIKE